MSVQQLDSTGIRCRIENYEQNAEQWKIDHQNAMRCFNLEVLLQHGLSIYQAIKFSDVALRELICSGDSDMSLDQLEEVLQEFYQAWIKPCKEIEGSIESFREGGYEVKFSVKFFNKCEEARDRLEHLQWKCASRKSRLTSMSKEEW